MRPFASLALCCLSLAVLPVQSAVAAPPKKAANATASVVTQAQPDADAKANRGKDANGVGQFIFDTDKVVGELPRPTGETVPARRSDDRMSLITIRHQFIHSLVELSSEI